MQEKIKGFIYRWLVDERTVYIGRTIQSIESRTSSHKLEYLKQRKKGLVTKKFIEISKLPNEWNDILVDVLEEVDDIALLGERELYWFEYYSIEGDLWNSILPNDSEYLVLTTEERLKRESDNNFLEFYKNFVQSVVQRLIKDLRKELYKIRLVPLDKNSFKITKPTHAIDVNDIFTTKLNEHKNQPYFRDLINYLISKQDSLTPSLSLLLNSENIIQIDFEQLVPYLNDSKSEEIDDLKDYFADNGNWLFTSKRSKSKINSMAKKLLTEFEETYSRRISEFKYFPILMSHRKIFQKRINILEEEFANFKADNEVFIDKLITYLRGGKVRIPMETISTDFFRRMVGINNINGILTRQHFSPMESTIIKGYDIDRVYKTEFLNDGSIIVSVANDYEVLSSTILVNLDGDSSKPVSVELQKREK